MKEGPQTWDEFDEVPVSVKKACISPDGTRIAAVFADKTLCVYDASTGEAIFPPFKVDENPRSVILSQDGKLVGSGGQALRLRNAQTGEEVESFDINVYSLALSPDGTCIVAGCEGRACPLFDEREPEVGSYNIRVINFKPEMELAKIILQRPHFFVTPSRKRIMLLKGEVSSSPFEGHENHVKSVAYSPDGKQIASGSDDFTVRVWEVSTGLRRTFRAHSNEIGCLAFSPDGTLIVSDTTLIILSTGRCFLNALGKANFPGRAVDPFAFSADGRYLAWGGLNWCCKIHDASTHQTIVQLVGHTAR